LAIRRALAAKPASAPPPTVQCGLASDTGYPYSGKLESVESRVDPATGTVRCRAVLANKDGVLVPGMFARVRLAMGEPHKALLVPERSLQNDQGQKFVFIVNDQNIAERRNVETGPLQDDRLRAVMKGVKADEWVVTSDMQKVWPGMSAMPGMTVTPEKTEIRTK
jgi:RND family efflux transporter MFP subunit